MPRKLKRATSLPFIKGYLERYKRELKELRNLNKIARRGHKKIYKEQIKRIRGRVKFLKNIENEISLEKAKTIYDHRNDINGFNIILDIHPSLNNVKDWLSAITIIEYCEWKINKENLQ